MALSDYQKYFSEYQQGSLNAVALLNKPIRPNRDIRITEEKQKDINNVVHKSAKNQHGSIIFFVSVDSDKANQLNTIVYELKRPLCFVSCKAFVSHYIGETEKNLSRLLATAETKNWTLFFDEADALLNNKKSSTDANNEELGFDLSYLLKRFSQHPNLVILSIENQDTLDKLEHRMKPTIHFLPAGA